MLQNGRPGSSLPVLAATFTTAIVFFPVVFLYGVSRFLFIALALGVVLSLFASYIVAMTVVPLFCARFIKTAHGTAGITKRNLSSEIRHRLQSQVRPDADALRSRRGQGACASGADGLVIIGSFVVSLALYPLLGLAFFPRTDPGQFVINIKAPTGTRLEMTDQYVGRIENDIREVIPADDLQMIVSNIGLTPDLSVDLHQQFRTAHRLRANQPERRSTSSAASPTWIACGGSCVGLPELSPISRQAAWWILS